MDDLISRTQAIDALDCISGVEEVLRSLPSAQPPHSGRRVYMAGYAEGYEDGQSERKKGKWIIYVISMLDGEGCKCSECGFEGAPYWDFCPNCGADMREETK